MFGTYPIRFTYFFIRQMFKFGIGNSFHPNIKYFFILYRKGIHTHFLHSTTRNTTIERHTKLKQIAQLRTYNQKIKNKTYEILIKYSPPTRLMPKITYINCWPFTFIKKMILLVTTHNHYILLLYCYKHWKRLYA